MNIYTYGGPTYNDDNLKPFELNDIPLDHKNYMNGIPHKWNFKPFFFGLKDFDE